MKSRIFASIFALWLATIPAFAQPKAYHGDGADDVLRFVPVASVFALKACGVESSSSWKRLVVNTAASIAISSGATWGLKHFIDEERPDGTDQKSFPSGHATFAFAGAHQLYKEYSRQSVWIPYGGLRGGYAGSYDPATKKATFTLKHTVSAGSFGTFTDVLTMP